MVVFIVKKAQSSLNHVKRQKKGQIENLSLPLNQLTKSNFYEKSLMQRCLFCSNYYKSSQLRYVNCQFESK